MAGKIKIQVWNENERLYWRAVGGNGQVLFRGNRGGYAMGSSVIRSIRGARKLLNGIPDGDEGKFIYAIEKPDECDA